MWTGDAINRYHLSQALMIPTRMHFIYRMSLAKRYPIKECKEKEKVGNMPRVKLWRGGARGREGVRCCRGNKSRIREVVKRLNKVETVNRAHSSNKSKPVVGRIIRP